MEIGTAVGVLIATAIGLLILYYIIKGAVGAAIRENRPKVDPPA